MIEIYLLDQCGEKYEDCLAKTPLVVDLDRNGFHFTGLGDPVFFDFDGDNTVEALGWTDGSQRDGFLVRDLNGNGIIDDGSELFGNYTLLLDGTRAPHGFLALAEHDTSNAGGNEDGLIDSYDLVFDELRIWIDANHDGATDEGELLTLVEAGISSLELDFVENQRRDQHGNLLRYNGWVWMAGPGAGEVPAQMTDVLFVSE